MQRYFDELIQGRNLEEFVPRDPPQSHSQHSNRELIHFLKGLRAFYKLWIPSLPNSPAFLTLADPFHPSPSHIQDNRLAVACAEKGRSLTDNEAIPWLADNYDGPNPAIRVFHKAAKTAEGLWSGSVHSHNGRSVSALLEDSFEPVLSADGTEWTMQIECLRAVLTKIRHVVRRLHVAHKLAPGMGSSMIEDCTALWLAHFGIGLPNLSKWQALVLAVKAKEVSDYLDSHHPIINVSQDPALPPAYSRAHQHLASLTSRMERRNGVSQEELRAMWA